MSFWPIPIDHLEVYLFLASALSLVTWLYLSFGHGRFWYADQRLGSEGLMTFNTTQWPTIVVVVPARNEADVIERTLRSLLEQDYPGEFHVVMVDDQSEDGTGDIARQLAIEHPGGARLTVNVAEDRPSGWLGKVWALHTGLQYAEQHWPNAAYRYLTDADIEHSRGNLRELVSKAEFEELDLVSLMVRLHCEHAWEKLLIPAFVYFFQKLYPFPLINDHKSTVGGAAGGCILVRNRALLQIGGIEVIRGEVIDDCALGTAMKRIGKIWVGLTDSEHSIRPYLRLHDIWTMVKRTAYTQLRYSPLMLAGTVMGLVVVYLLPPLVALTWPLHGSALAGGLAVFAWLIMMYTFQPTLRLYALAPTYGLVLPIAAFLYLGMTVDSAYRYWLKIGGQWKGRTGIGCTD
ncbi:glycosyltransferase [Candidatus Nitrospira neomarina]|uniref:Glycosyltransferase n=1 Tax=Candidatus Nitrospira neomarina TaxID=3020899 RepID=A0AA96K3F6_9BACT|nr:glycosyltransferase [Candidatus Nitrospira neomarina]WNM62549.1 glycosyltransferase [Candidatus Nitrospira neomarina]